MRQLSLMAARFKIKVDHITYDACCRLDDLKDDIDRQAQELIDERKPKVSPLIQSLFSQYTEDGRRAASIQDQMLRDYARGQQTPEGNFLKLLGFR